MSVQPEPPAYGQSIHPQPVQPQTNTTVVITQPAPVQNDKLVTPKEGHRDWSSGTMSCLDDAGKCALAVFCPECVLMDMATRLGESPCVALCIPGGLIAMRTRMRTLGGIRGSICQDYFALYCCYMCTICQMHRELDHMGL